MKDLALKEGQHLLELSLISRRQGRSCLQLPNDLLGREGRKLVRRVGKTASDPLGPLDESGLVLRRPSLRSVGGANSLEKGVNVAPTQGNGS